MTNIVDLPVIAFTVGIGLVFLFFGFKREAPVIHAIAFIWFTLWAGYLGGLNAAFAQSSVYTGTKFVYDTLSSYPMLWVYLFSDLIALYGIIEAITNIVSSGKPIRVLGVRNRGNRGL